MNVGSTSINHHTCFAGRFLLLTVWMSPRNCKSCAGNAICVRHGSHFGNARSHRGTVRNGRHCDSLCRLRRGFAFVFQNLVEHLTKVCGAGAAFMRVHARSLRKLIGEVQRGEHGDAQ